MEFTSSGILSLQCLFSTSVPFELILLEFIAKGIKGTTTMVTKHFSNKYNFEYDDYVTNLGHLRYSTWVTPGRMCILN